MKWKDQNVNNMKIFKNLPFGLWFLYKLNESVLTKVKYISWPIKKCIHQRLGFYIANFPPKNKLKDQNVIHEKNVTKNYILIKTVCLFTGNNMTVDLHAWAHRTIHSSSTICLSRIPIYILEKGPKCIFLASELYFISWTKM